MKQPFGLFSLGIKVHVIIFLMIKVLNFVIGICSPSDPAVTTRNEIEMMPTKRRLKKPAKMRKSRLDYSFSFSSRCTRVTLTDDGDSSFGGDYNVFETSTTLTSLTNIFAPIFENENRKSLNSSIFEVGSDDEEGEECFALKEESFGKRLLNNPCITSADIKSVFE